jgi:sulfur-carrier protein adenylyltransferase/sulfurtransferase
MSIMDYFKSVSTMKVRELKEFLREKNPGEYNLIDVRQPREYERGHIPGARLIPVSELRNHIHELDPEKPAIVY